MYTSVASHGQAQKRFTSVSNYLLYMTKWCPVENIKSRTVFHRLNAAHSLGSHYGTKCSIFCLCAWYNYRLCITVVIFVCQQRTFIV